LQDDKQMIGINMFIDRDKLEGYHLHSMGLCGIALIQQKFTRIIEEKIF
jgi:hypothetical protein